MEKEQPSVRYPQGLGAGAAILGVMALAGWASGCEPLRSLFVGVTAMNPLTAACLAAGGCCLILSRSAAYGRATIFAVGSIVAALAFLKTLSFAGWDLGIDAWMFHKSLAAYSPPNRMAPNTALCLLLSASALAAMSVRGSRAAAASQSLALSAAGISLFAMLGYGYRVPLLYGVAAFIPMALNTALALAMIDAGVLLARSDEGWMAQIANEGPGGIMARRLLPFTVAIPGLLGYVSLGGQWNGWYAPEIGVALLAVGLAIFFSALVWYNAVLLEQVDLRRRASELDLQDHARRLEQANRELDAFSYSVSHDLRAPLRAIDSFSKVLLEDNAARLDEDGKRALSHVRENTGRMSELIEDLLSLAKVSRRELRRETFDLGVLAKDVIQKLRSADAARAAVEFVAPAGLAVHADAGLVRIVLENLLGNAWKFSSKTPGARIEVGRSQVDGAEAFFVRDNGAGFDMADADRLFGAFQRLHSQSEFPGTGIGLTTVQRIVHRHGGRIWAESAVGKGTTFRFTLR